LINVGVGVPLVLCLMTVGLWVRSYWRQDILDLPAGPRDLRVCSVDHHFLVVVSRIRPGTSSTRVHWGAYAPEEPIENWWRDILTTEPWHGFAIDRSSIENTWLLIPQRSVATATAIPSMLLIATRLRSRGRNPGRCPNCGYNLTGNASGVCPECGTPIAQRVEATA
jgi:hypothetical protein